MPHDNLWVVGGKPQWYIGNYIFAPSDPNVIRLKFDRERVGLQTIADSEEISDDFILMNDDFFITKRVENFLDWNGGTLQDKVELYTKIVPRNIYTNCLRITYDGLVKMGYENPLDFELHVPMKMNKANLNESLKHSTSLWRSVYGNMFINKSEQHDDVKVYRDGSLMKKSYDYLNGDLPYFSTIDGSFEMVKDNMLGEMFNTPSIYEHP